MNSRLIGKKITGIVMEAALIMGMAAFSATTGYSQYGNYGGYRANDGYPNLGGSRDLRQTALNAGANDGTKEARKGNYRGGPINFNDFSAYRNATHDYSSKLGDREIYRRYYQLAFESGYKTTLGVRDVDIYGNGGYNRNTSNRYPDYNNNNRYPDNSNNRYPDYNNNNRYPDTNNGYPVWNDPNYRQNRPGREWDRYGSYGGNSNFRQTALNAGYNEGIKQGRKDRGRGSRDPNDFSSYRDASKDYSSKLGGNIELYRRYYREGFQNGYADGLNGY